MPGRPLRLSFLGIYALGLLVDSSRPALGEDFRRHAVVSQEEHASEVGADAMRAGGNAVDAAVASAFALAVTHPAAGNIGGGGFLVAHLADRQEVVTVDFREVAPDLATERMYLDESGELLPNHRAGPGAAGVPGTVAGLALVHREHGRLPWADLVRPAARLARDGFPVSEPLAIGLNAQLFDDVAAGPNGVPEDLGPGADRLADFPASVRAFRKPDGTPWAAGDVLKQPDLAETLDRIAERGAAGFYRGETADRIVEAMQAAGGLITHEDLQSYEAKFRPPVYFTYRGRDVYGMGPPASGGAILAMTLQMLEPMDLRDDGPTSASTVHRVAETMRRAFYVRATALADPDFESIPLGLITSRAYAAELAEGIGERATPSESLADFPIEGVEGEHTTHLSTIDADGNAVAMTYTLEEGYGSKAVVAGAGFLLNNEMGDFNLVPGRTTTGGRVGTEANRIAPHKRMLSSQSPTIVLRDGRVEVVTGSPGGRTIPNTVLWVVLNVLEFDLDPDSAVRAPRTHHQWFPDRLLLEGSLHDGPLAEELRARGHQVGRIDVQGDAHTIVKDLETGAIHAVPDPRRRTARARGD